MPENYPAWQAAIEAARRTIHLEMYIVHDDATGRRFRDLLVARARAGVTVRVLYDWFGSLRLIGRGFWAPLRAAGGEVRVANPPSLDSLLGWASRDHRKLLTIDGSEAFISGLCIGDAWTGDPARGIAPWRDTGVQLRGRRLPTLRSPSPMPGHSSAVRSHPPSCRAARPSRPRGPSRSV